MNEESARRHDFKFFFECQGLMGKIVSLKDNASRILV